MTDYEREELAYEMWELSGGRERQKLTDQENLDAILADAESKGWEVLKRFESFDGNGGTCEHVVLLRTEHKVVDYCMYNSFNKGLMKKADIGSYIWRVW